MKKESIGLEDLDEILHGIRAGDNIVWQVNQIDDYLEFVKPFCDYALKHNKKIVYFRFARHKQLISDNKNIEIHKLKPEEGFEQFITEIHKVIQEKGKGTYYVFDSHSDLASYSFSDRMLGNFFLLTCPFLYELETIAFFAIYRYYHSYHAIYPLKKTTQLLLDVYHYQNHLYVKPIKVHKRYSPSMYLLHRWDENDKFTTIKQSALISKILKSKPWPGLQSASYRLVGQWDRRFMRAEEILEASKIGEASEELIDKMLNRLLPHLIAREGKILELAKKYFKLEDILFIWKRMIGCGMVGGKSAGMLIARKILQTENSRWKELLEEHDSFYIGSDVFFSFLVENGCWLIKQKQKNADSFLEDAEKARQRILNGEFPENILKRFLDMLEYFGQSPIIVRSSSLLEDNYGNAFAGKYESVFCSNQGKLSERLDEFLNAVRVIYASTMSDEALKYRAERGVLEKDEQMALLVQRVSGEPYCDLFFPHMAGVGFSFNPYVWNEEIKQDSGMIRIVFGLGTRAVDRSDDDYTRVVALNAPDKRPESTFDEVKRYSQKRIDVLDLTSNEFTSKYFTDVMKKCDLLPIELFATKDKELAKKYKNDITVLPWVLTFEKVIKETNFINDMQELFEILKLQYEKNVDVEFAVNFFPDKTYKINLLQCRPFQIKENTGVFNGVSDLNKDDIIMETHSGVVGKSREIEVHKIIYVNPEQYSRLPMNERYAVARIIGKITHKTKKSENNNILLIGPGRWGTSMPSLGVPVKFNEINNVSVICEIDILHDHLVPDLSLGTHFFNEMVEMDILYLAYFNANKENCFNFNLINGLLNHLSEYTAESRSFDKVVKVVHCCDIAEKRKIYLNADALKQNTYLFKK